MNNYDELLRRAVESGMIDLCSVQQAMDKKERENYLKLHTHNVWQGSNNGKWYTYLPEKEGRKLVKRTTEDKIHDAIVEHYKSKKEEPTIDSVFSDWINKKIEDKEISRGTYDRYLNDYKRFFSKEMADIKIASVTEEDLAVFIRQTIIDHQLTHKAYSNFRTLILGIFKFAKQKKYTAISISSFIQDLALPKTIFTKVIKNKEAQIYLEDEIPKAVEYLKSNTTMVNLGLLLAFQTGLRCGELAALKPTDIVGKTIHVQRQEIKYKDAVTQKTIPEIKAYPKTDCGNRYVIITDNALETLKMIKNLNPDGEFLFETNGNRLKYYNYNNGIAHMCKTLSITQKSMHKIRRTYGTTLIDAGVAESLIAQQMGHSDIATTRAFYYYSNKAQKTQEAQIEKALTF